MVKLDDIVKKTITVVLVLLFLFFLWWHLQMSFTRYFDVDEFAHLSWTAHWVAGNKPYVDFLTFFPPGFMVFLAPLFIFGNTGILPLLAARFLMFLVYLGMLGSLGYLFWLMRKSWLWVMAIVILAFLPLPKDKFIEIRPDSLATLLGLIAVIFQIRWIRSWKDQDGIIAGIFNSVSLLVLPKMVPQVVIAILIGLLASLGKTGGIKGARRVAVNMLPFGLGFAIPFVMFSIWALSLGNLGTVIYSLTKLPVEANKISQVFIMLPNLFFYPNGIFYGENGYPLGLILNHTIWFLGLIIGVYRLLTPYLTKEKSYIYEELLVAGIFYIHIIFYVSIAPLKHTQYLIPIVVFIAFFTADAFEMLWHKAKKNAIGLCSFLFLIIMGTVFLFEGYYKTNQVKLSWTNNKMLASLKSLYKYIPTNEYILDLDGRTLYYPYPYYACCIPFGQSSSYLSRPLPSLAQALERTQTKYIYQGELRRTDTLRPEDQEYINNHYSPVDGGGELLVRK